MKRFCAFLAIIASSIFIAQAQTTEINGVSKTSKPSMVRLFKVVYGRTEEIAQTAPAANGSFNFKFQPEYKGYYAIGFGDSKDVLDKYKLYVKGNEKINLELNDTTYALTGTNTKENQVLEQWYKLAYKLERKSVYFNRGRRLMAVFFPEQDNVLAKSKNWTVGKETGNADFDQLIKNTIDYDMAYFTLSFLITPRASKPNPNDYTAYTREFNADRYLQNEELLKFPYGTTMLRSLVAFKNKDVDYNDVATQVASISNNVLKGEYALGKMMAVRSYTNYTEMFDTYNKYFLAEDQKDRAKKIEVSLQKYKPGKEAINITYPDVADKQVSLTDFKGKIVLVDVWATWCGPCQKEMPYLKQLEEEFHGKDIVFLGVSLDEEKDKEKWKKFIVDRQLGGVQILASGWSKITKDYGIGGIPRFMLFDRNGNIINVDAPRPSDPKLKEVLNEYLSKSF